MKKTIHPAYQQVLFVDSASGHKFLCGTALQPEAKETFNGKEYPVSYLSISSSSHPFFTGSKQLVDSEGRVEKFKKRFGRKDAAQDESGEPKIVQTQEEEAAASAAARKAASAAAAARKTVAVAPAAATAKKPAPAAKPAAAPAAAKKAGPAAPAKKPEADKKKSK